MEPLESPIAEASLLPLLEPSVVRKAPESDGVVALGVELDPQAANE
jgi:hypothetical protein